MAALTDEAGSPLLDETGIGRLADEAVPAARLAEWPDFEAMLADALGDLAPVVTFTTPVIAANLPQVKVRRIGGADDWTTDTGRVDITAYAATIAAAKILAGLVRQRLIPGAVPTSAGVIDRVFTETGPAELDTGDPALIRAMHATYRLTARRRQP